MRAHRARREAKDQKLKAAGPPNTDSMVRKARASRSEVVCNGAERSAGSICNG